MQHVHDYEVAKSTTSAMVEVCRECKKRLITKMDARGRIDNKAFLKEHQRDTAQPRGSTAKVFQKYYGNNKTT